MWSLVSLALASMGVRPGLHALGWIGIAGAFGLSLLGPLFDLPDWALSISPYHHIPEVVGSDPSWGATAWVAAATAALTVTAFVGFQRRDVH